MRHRRTVSRFNRTAEHKNAMIHNMVNSLFKAGRIETTLDRAKEARRVAEKMITLSKEDDLNNRRQVYDFVRSRDMVADLFKRIGKFYTTRPGGYTRILRLGKRTGDDADIVYLELVGYETLYGEVIEEKAEKRRTKQERLKAKKEKEEAIAAQQAAANAAPEAEEEKKEKPAKVKKPKKEK